MSTETIEPPRDRAPVWLTAVAVGGIAWNLYGIVQFAALASATPESLAAGGLTPEQAAAMTGHPAWMTAAFALGVAGGLAGSVLLALRRARAGVALGASLAGYVALWIGDAAHGVFAAMGATQVVVLTLVVAIAAALYVASRHPAARGASARAHPLPS